MATVVMAPKRKILLSVKDWSSEESIHTFKFLKAHLLQAGKDGAWNDEMLVVHVAKSKEKDKEKWDHGSAVIADLHTALQPYKHDVYDLEGDAGQLLVDIADKERADILVLASRGRNAMKKAMMGSMTDSVIKSASCACLVVKPQIGAGDTYRMKTAANPQAPLQHVPSLQLGRAGSPCGSPMYGRMSSSMATPFNRRVAVVYDTTASGRFLLKWATDMVLEPADNVFVVRAVPKAVQKMRSPTTSFADKNSVQRLAGDSLPSQAHVTAFNVQFSQQQGNRCRSVLSFVAKESVDLLIIGLYKANSRRKGLALKGNALALASRCACSCLVVPMSDSALISAAEAADLAATAEEEEELVSGSEDESDEEDDPTTPTHHLHNGATGDTDEEPGATAVDTAAGSPDTLGSTLAMRGASAMKQIRAPLEALFKRRGSTTPGSFTQPVHGAEGGSLSAGGGLPAGLDARRSALLATLQGAGGGLPGGKYVVEVDANGALKHIKVLVDKHHPSSLSSTVVPLAIPAAADADSIRMLSASGTALTAAAAAGAGAGVHRQSSTGADTLEAAAPAPPQAAGMSASASTGSLTAAAAAAAAATIAEQQPPRRTASASDLVAADAAGGASVGVKQ